MQTQTHIHSLTVLWQNGDNHHTGQFGTLSATVAPFEDWGKGKNPKTKVQHISMLLHFGRPLPPPSLPPQNSLGLMFIYTCRVDQEIPSSCTILALLLSTPRRTSYLLRYHTWILISLTKRSKGRCKKSASSHMLYLGTSFPQASGPNTGGSALGNDPPNGTNETKCLH